MFGIVGLPVPDEFLLTSCGYLVYQGHLSLFPTIAAGLLGSGCGITCSYTIGRTVGWKILHSKMGRFFHIDDNRIRLIHDWFGRIGHWALFLGYFVPGFRHFTAIVAGTSRLELRSFATFAYAGALAWVCTFVFLGYHFGAQWQEILALVEHHLKIASVVAGALIVLYVGWRYWSGRRTGRA